MRAGNLDRLVTIERFTNTVDDFGTPVATWAEVATLRAQIVSASTEEFIRNGAEAETVIVFRTRYLAGVTTADRIGYQGAAFNIKETTEIGRRKGLELRCVRAE
ncbi:putative Phage head-tail adaptor [uncultured Pleomorphomonas sp.]|uniref:Putative Phage head-tail adaptor n=1 Tax=uncultured Pleomorphomonas sp. TaxID=442121 RepID=A0A212KXK3_9HYPH|nr:phage head closure protein [uncultured Pleomorphomonas sp.]SCM70028.1 putative Phage head-tail adaptor [uncultured Pleomorphomonas sp.]SCM75124.1 putative Phage head-tail adaptor [uncultured Pleomorphomonas sp.]